MEALAVSLAQNTHRLRGQEDFPKEMIRQCAQFENEWPDFPKNTLSYYVAIAFGCLTTAFIMTQRHAAIRRIESSDHSNRDRWLREIKTGEAFATVGISHLTTSRRHLSTPPVQAHRAVQANGAGQAARVDNVRGDEERWILHGCIPWVTGAFSSDYIVVGAVEGRPTENSGTLRNRPQNDEKQTASDTYSAAEIPMRDQTREMLFLLPTATTGVEPGKGMELLALSSSCTDEVRLDGVELSNAHLLHGPCENVMAASQSKSPTSGSTAGGSSGAGGAQTSALALGLAASAIDWLYGESAPRPNLSPYAESLANSWGDLYEKLVSIERGNASIDSNALRKQCNDLALQSTQAALAAAKGAGFLENHPVSKWCKEAMFFLVWSCPQWVAEAHLCSFSSMDTNLQ
jgi:alkylation response protein AidB-like acyl-CoA dehydrogenase